MLVDSWYDAYLGVIVLVRVIDGVMKKGQQIRMMGTDARYLRSTGRRDHAEAGGHRKPRPRRDRLHHRLDQGSGRYPRRRHDHRGQAPRPLNALPGFKPAQPVVFCGLFPVDAADFEDLRAAMGKLRLNDASRSPSRWKPRPRSASASAAASSASCTWRSSRSAWSREFDLDLIATAPSVVYRMNMTDGDVIELHNPADMPDVVKIASIEEPWIKATILTPDDYLGPILKLCQERRGIQTELSYVGKRAMVTYQLPLNEVVFDFYDRLKSISKGYASFDYQITGHRAGRSRQDVDPRQRGAGRRAVDAGAPLGSGKRGRVMCEKLKDLIPRHMFKIPIQARHRRQGHRPREPSRPCART
jgi:GTP-binding protein LepA